MASSATVTVLFCDVVGSTERLVRLGDIVADEHRRELFAGLTEADFEPTPLGDRPTRVRFDAVTHVYDSFVRRG